MSDLAQQRRFFAEEIETVAGLRSQRLVEALASVPRESFLRPGPWLIMGGTDLLTGPRPTADDDPRRLCHNVAIVIDRERHLFNGHPSTLAQWIDALDPAPGGRILHLGCGLGYYTALLADCVGPGGRVLALDIDEGLAAEARANLRTRPWVDVRTGDGTAPLGESFDGMLINAGVTHPLDGWLDALAPGGRMVLSLTFTLDASTTIGKGLTVVVSRNAEGGLDARTMNVVAIFSAVGIRDPALNQSVLQAFQRTPLPSLRRLRRDRHEPEASCWLHGGAFCLATA
jgi:protein-L-isoaspartate(D-aspartate) O-methyltransferase